MTQLLEVSGATVSYNGSPVVSNASLVVNAGDYIGIVGPSGSGKTTLLKVIAGSITPSAGTVKHVSDLRIGYVPQVDQINWHFPVTVMEVVLMASSPRRPLPWSSREEKLKARSMLEHLGISELGDRHIRALSGGQQQRVFIARALLSDPQLLLLDEPTSGVDVATRHDVLHVLHDLNHDDGIAIVITTHDLNGIAAHMHDLICLNTRVIAAGHPAEILTPEVLEATYGAPMDVLSHGGMPVVVEHFEDHSKSPLGSAHHEHADEK